MSADVRFVFALAAIVNVAGALASFVLAARLRRAVAATRTWSAVTGRVVASRLVPGRRTAAADVVYAYVVDDQTYTGPRVHLGHRVGGLLIGMSHDAARRLLERYPPGAAVVVYYDPARPEQAVLEPGEDSGLARLLVIAGGGALVVAAIFATVAWGSG